MRTIVSSRIAGEGLLKNVTSLPSYLPTLLPSKRSGFTLAEVLITLAIVGVVAAVTLPPFVTNIKNKGYVEQLKKVYSILQTATNEIIVEEGLPSSWGWPDYRVSDSMDAGLRILKLYAEKLNAHDLCLTSCYYGTNCCIPKSLNHKTYKRLSGKYVSANDGYYMYNHYRTMVLNDESIVAFRFKSIPGNVMWGWPDFIIMVDINGAQPPNIVGRDLFYFYMEANGKGRIIPMSGNFSFSAASNKPVGDDCNKEGLGYTCAHKVLVKDVGQMKY